MVGPGCILNSQRQQFEKNKNVQEFARINNISLTTAINWIQSWQTSNAKKNNFLEAVKENPFKTYHDITDYRQQEFNKRMNPTSYQVANNFSYLHKSLSYSSTKIIDAIQLMEQIVFALYNEYQTYGVYNNIEDYLSNGELGIYDDVYNALNWSITPRGSKQQYVLYTLIRGENDKNIILTEEQAKLIQTILSGTNFDTLWHLFKIHIKGTQGVQIGQSIAPGNFIEEINSSIEVLDKGENDENSGFSYEESHREAWQQVKEFMKPMKQLSKETRRIFAHIPQLDANGNIAMSTFGVPRYESPNFIHKKVSGILLGVRNESQMIKWLQQAEQTDKQISYIINQIYNDYGIAQYLQQQDMTDEEKRAEYGSMVGYVSHLRTTMLADFRKNPMTYAVSKIRRKSRDIWQYITFINTSSNQIGDQLWQGYRNMISAKNNILADSLTIFNKQGRLKTNSIRTAASTASNFFIKTDVKAETSDNYAKERTENFFTKLSIQEQRNRIIAALRQLGIRHNANDITKLLRTNHPDKFTLVSNLYDTFTFITGTGTKTRKENSLMIDALTQSTEGQNWDIGVAMSQVLRIVNGDNMVGQHIFRPFGSYMNPIKGYVEYQTAQLCGFLSDMFEDIRQAKENTLSEDNIYIETDSNGHKVKKFRVNYVHKYIEDHFLQDPMFVEYEPQEDSEGNPLLDQNGNPVKPKYKEHRKGYPVIRNPWLDELWRNAESIETMKNSNSFINQFQHYQFVGSQKDMSDPHSTTHNADWKTWEDFNGIQHMSLLMNAYVQSYRTNQITGQSKEAYADYPTFILGDSGKLKFIRSRRYKVNPDKATPKEERIMTHFKSVVQQEIEFAKQQYMFQNNNLVGMGYKPIKVLSEDKLLVKYPNGKYFYRIQSFPEINDKLQKKAEEQKVDFKESQTKVASRLAIILETNMEKWITEIMEDRLTKFKQKCENEGILKQEEVKIKVKKDNESTVTAKYTIYPNLPLGKDSGYKWKTDGTDESEQENQQELDRFLRDFYYNSTLAMIEQIQLVTLSPAFYPHSVEMQKRMKQIHANGRRPSLEALDWNGVPYMMRNGKYDTNMNYILLNDVIGNPSQAQNEDFMNTVAYVHGRYSQEFYQFIDKNPNATEEEKTNKAIEIGKQSNQYKTFAATSYTDGQGYRTLEGYRKVKGALGEWSSEDETNYRRILEIREKHKDNTPWTKSEKQEVAKMTSRWQPIKPFTYGFQRIQTVSAGVGTRISIPTQIKCSECLIIPELLPTNSRLYIITKYLENKCLDCAYFDSCVKVGAFGQAETYYANNPDNEITIEDSGKVSSKSNIWSEKNPTNLKPRLKKDENFELMDLETLRNTLYQNPTSMDDEGAFVSPRIHSLSYEYYVEQTSVPEHTYDSRTIGTQIRKIFFDGLSYFEYDDKGNVLKDQYGNPKLKSYASYVGGNLITLPNGKKATLDSKEQLVKFYSSLHCANVLAQFDSILNIIKNDTTLSKELQKVALKSSNESLQKLIMYAVHETMVDGEKKGKFTLPLFENSMEHDAAATLISIFRKASTQLQIQGGSLVQASAYGIRGIKWIGSTEEGKHAEDDLKVICKNGNVLYSECEVPFVQEYTDKFGKKQKLKFEDYCDADGNLLYVQITKKNKDGSTKKISIPKLERDFPGSTEMICYRIPSEKDYSAVVLRVKRFTKPVEGGIIRLPVQITSITGADFDIDKMFLMRPQYVQRQDATTLDEYINSHYKAEFLGQVWKNVYDSNYFGTDGRAIQEALEQVKESYVSANGINDKDAESLYLNQFWEEAVEKYPNAFKGNDGEFYTDKQAFFEASLKDVHPNSKGAEEKFNRLNEYKWYRYDYNLPVDKQIKDKKQKSVKTDVVVRNNMMLQLMKARLQDPQTVRSRTTPGGFVDAENAAEDIRYTEYADKSYIEGDQFDWQRFEQLKEQPDPNESLNYADPFTLVEFNKQNQIANKLVGTFANLNSFKQMLNSLEDAKLKKPIKMFGREADSLVKLSDQDIKENRNSSLFVAEMLAAAVDSVKNPTLKFLNITQSTAYVAGLMAMTGFTHREIGIFLNQPIIKEITKHSEQNNCGLKEAIKHITQKYYSIDGQPKSLQDSVTYSSNLTEGKLLDKLVGGEEVNSIEKNKDDANFMNHQFSVLSALSQLTDTSLSLKSFVSASKMTSANSIQSTYGSLYNIIQSAEALNQIADEDVQILLFPYSSKRGIKNPIDVNLDTDSPAYMDQVLDTVFPIEQVIYDVVKKFVGETNKFFPYQNRIYKSARDFFRNANKKEAVLMPKTIDAIHRYVQNWCLQNIPNCPSLFGGATIEVGAKKYSVKNYFLDIFPSEFKKFIDRHAEKYPTLYKCLTIDENSRIILNYGFNKDNDADAFTAEWRQLINDNKENNDGRLNVGEALYFYNFHASSFNFGSTTFDHLMPQDMIPNIVIAQLPDYSTNTITPIRYKDILEYIQGDYYQAVDEVFKVNFLRENYNNNELVKQIYDYEQASIFGENDVIIDMTASDTHSKFGFLELKVEKHQGNISSITYPMAIHVNNRIYIAMNAEGVVENTVPANGKLIYKVYSTEVEDKGYKMNEENTPVEGTFLDPISWDELESVTNEDIAYDVVKALQNKMIDKTAGDELNIQDYVQFTDDILRDIRENNIGIDSIQLAQRSFKSLQNAYNSFKQGNVLTTEQTQELKQVNAGIILEAFVDIMCPNINKLTGEQRRDIYNMIASGFTDSSGNINIEQLTINDIRVKIINQLLANRIDIEQITELATKADILLTMLKEDDGRNPLLPIKENKDGDSVMPECR